MGEMKNDIWKNVGWVALTAMWSLGGLAAILAAAMMPMMFDAAGSESNPFTVGLAVSIVALPLFCFSGAVLPWILRRRSFATKLFLLPVIDLAAIAIFLIALSYFCDGQFSCGTRFS
jgi:ABC-type sulfate transport system permease subunit